MADEAKNPAVPWYIVPKDLGLDLGPDVVFEFL